MTQSYRFSPRRQEVLGAQQAIKRFAAKLPAAQGVTGGYPNLTPNQTAQVLFLDELRSARRAQKLTQSQLAAKVGTSQVTIARLETGKVSPTLDTVFGVLEALGLNISIN